MSSRSSCRAKRGLPRRVSLGLALLLAGCVSQPMAPVLEPPELGRPVAAGIAQSEFAGLLDADVLGRLVLLQGPGLAEARAELRVLGIALDLGRRPAAPMLALSLRPGGMLGLEAMLLQPLAELMNRDLLDRRSELRRVEAITAYAERALDALLEAQRQLHAAIVGRQLIALSAQAIALAEDRLDRARRQHRAGEVDTAALREAQSELQSIRLERAREEHAQAERLQALAWAAGLADAGQIQLPDDLPELWASLAAAEANEPSSVNESLNVRRQRLQLERATLQHLLQQRWATRWMPGLGLEAGRGMGGTLLLEFSPPAWQRQHLQQALSAGEASLQALRLEQAEARQALAVQAALLRLDAAGRAEQQARARHALRQEEQQRMRELMASGEAGLGPYWAAAAARIEAEREHWQAQQTSLDAGLDLVSALGRLPDR